MFKKQITLLFFMTVFYIKAFATDSDITEKSQISYVFKDINSNQTLSQHNHHIYMHPASCQTITALAGLKILGRLPVLHPSYQQKKRLGLTGKVI